MPELLTDEIKQVLEKAGFTILSISYRQCSICGKTAYQARDKKTNGTTYACVNGHTTINSGPKGTFW